MNHHKQSERLKHYRNKPLQKKTSLKPHNVCSILTLTLQWHMLLLILFCFYLNLTAATTDQEACLTVRAIGANKHTHSMHYTQSHTQNALHISREHNETQENVSLCLQKSPVNLLGSSEPFATLTCTGNTHIGTAHLLTSDDPKRGKCSVMCQEGNLPTRELFLVPQRSESFSTHRQLSAFFGLHRSEFDTRSNILSCNQNFSATVPIAVGEKMFIRTEPQKITEAVVTHKGRVNTLCLTPTQLSNTQFIPCFSFAQWTRHFYAAQYVKTISLSRSANLLTLSSATQSQTFSENITVSCTEALRWAPTTASFATCAFFYQKNHHIESVQFHLQYSYVQPGLASCRRHGTSCAHTYKITCQGQRRYFAEEICLGDKKETLAKANISVTTIIECDKQGFDKDTHSARITIPINDVTLTINISSTHGLSIYCENSPRLSLCYNEDMQLFEHCSFQPC